MMMITTTRHRASSSSFATFACCRHLLRDEYCTTNTFNNNNNNNNRRRSYHPPGKRITLKEYVVGGGEEEEKEGFSETKLKTKMVFPELNKHLIISNRDDDIDDEEEEKMMIGKNQVLVKVRAFSVNPLDAEVARGYLAKFLPRLDGGEGIRLGKDFSGEIVKLGRGGGDGGKFEIGDEVFGAISAADFRNGTMAEYVLVDRKQLMRKPKRLTHKEACAIPFAAYTAYACLRMTRCVDRKDPKRILVFGGGSAVGECVARIALRSGFATTVVATAGKASEQMLMEDVGVERVIGYENKKKDGEMKNQDDGDSSSSSSGSTTSSNSSGSSSHNSGDRKTSEVREGENFSAKNSRFVDDAEPSFDVAIDTVGTAKTKFQAAKALKKGTGTYITLHGDMAQLIGESGVLRGGAQASLELLREKAFARLQYDIGYDWGYANANDFDATNLIEYLVDKGFLSVKVYDDTKHEQSGPFLGLESVERAFTALGDASKKGKIVVEMP